MSAHCYLLFKKLSCVITDTTIDTIADAADAIADTIDHATE